MRPAILGKLGLSVLAFTLVTTWAVSQTYEDVSLGRPPAASTRMKLDNFLDGMKSFRLDEPTRKLTRIWGRGDRRYGTCSRNGW